LLTDESVDAPALSLEVHVLMISENIPMCELIDISLMSEGYGWEKFTADGFIHTHGESGIRLAPGQSQAENYSVGG
jgi:hypothetical protein